jgi:hypothetical protein
LGAFFFLGEYAKEFSKIAGDVKGSIFNKLRWKLQLDQEEFFNVFPKKIYENLPTSAFFKCYYLKSFKVRNDERKNHFTPLSL